MWRTSRLLAILAVLLVTAEGWTAPILSGGLVLDATMNSGGGGSMYNARVFDGYNYAVDISQGIIGQWPAHSSAPVFTVSVGSEFHRIVGAFRGANSSTYLLATSGAASPGTRDTLTRYDFNGTNPATAADPIPDTSSAVATFAWTGIADQLVLNAYQPGSARSKLYLANVTPNPFAVTLDTTTWPGGTKTTSSPYIRAVSTGSAYTNTAYYGDGRDGTGNFNFYALDIASGAETLLGNFGPLKTTGLVSYDNCIWTVTERGGYLYVQSARGDADGNVIKVYNMTDATTLGSLVTAYTARELTALTGQSTFYGFDASADGSRMVLSGSGGLAWEIVPEPATGVLAVTALVALLLFRWRRSRAA